MYWLKILWVNRIYKMYLSKIFIEPILESLRIKFENKDWECKPHSKSIIRFKSNFYQSNHQITIQN
jgi:hypothetical protein